ncbi:MAG TPA: zinc-ribbon domain-containing protein [Verrucomicrobiae bacterium]
MKEPNPISPLLKRLQTPEQKAAGNFLRKIGPLVFIAGLICTITAMVNFFSCFGSMEPPRLFWLGFIGLPLMFVGGVLSQFGFLGMVTRFVAGETAPVAADTVNYMADETKDAVETVAKSAAKGIVEGLEAGRAAATNFCPHCGFSVKANFQFCPKCGKALAA